MKKPLNKLMESNIEKAEIVLAVKGEIEDKLQRQSEILSNLGVDILGPLVDRIKAEHGLDAAEDFRTRISALLSQALDTLLHVKDQISTETLKLTGDVATNPEIADIAGTGDDLEVVDVDADIPEFDMTDDVSFDDDLDAALPKEREMKESVQKVRVFLETKKGAKGSKVFESRDSAESWIKENYNAIKRVVSIKKEMK